MDWKQWNLRIPLVLFLIGATAALYQSFPNLFLVESGFFVSVQYIGGIVLLFMLFEKIGLNQKKIHFTFGIYTTTDWFIDGYCHYLILIDAPFLAT